ncbi:MAG TPA: Ig domain-containing protein, partial [Acidimicrobiales bacterium]|nr:Ig domain-containing protein [Acidimicrobiales bacterium]
TITKTMGTLPTGVTLTDNGNGTATLAGTPATGTHGSYPITLSANNGVGTAATQSFTLTVNAVSTGTAPLITSGAATTFTEGIAGSFMVTTTGSPTPAITKTAGTLPTGITLTDNGNSTATLAGTPASGSAGTYLFTIQAANGVTPNATQGFTLTIENATTGGVVQCTGTLHGTFMDVMVPPQATCTLGTGTTVTHDVQVGAGGSLTSMGAAVGQDLYSAPGSKIRLMGGSIAHNLWIDRASLLYDLGASVGHDLGVDDAMSVGIQGGSVGHDVFVFGVTGPGPTGADNFLCGVTVGHDVGVFKTMGTSLFVIGDTSKDCTAPVNVGHNLYVVANASPLDVVGNTVAHDILFFANTPGGVVANTNSVGHGCNQSSNQPYSGSGNTGTFVAQCNSTSSAGPRNHGRH